MVTGRITQKIIEISHGQWLYRNFTLHSNTDEYLLLKSQEEILATVAQLAATNPAGRELIPAGVGSVNSV